MPPRAALVGAFLVLASAARFHTSARAELQDPRPATRADQHVLDSRMANVQRWLILIDEHQPGTLDAAAQVFAAWPNRDIRTLWIDATFLVRLMRNPNLTRFAITRPGQKAANVSYDGAQVAALRAFACAANGELTGADCRERLQSPLLDGRLRALALHVNDARIHGDPNYVLRRGALLHTDLAILAPPTLETYTGREDLAPTSFRLKTSDGQGVDQGQSGLHWEIARLLLDDVGPRGVGNAAPERDRMVRLWYRATAAWMQHLQHHDTTHLDRARELFPTDPDLLFLSATQHETYASPSVQSAIHSISLPAGVRLDIGNERAELRQAETFFRRALAARPEFPEAQIHLGRVLTLLGRAGEAVTGLRQGLDRTDDHLLRYYGSLFLGMAEAALQHGTEARRAYESAALLYPTSQSAQLGLSALAWQQGNRTNALQHLKTLFDLPSDDDARDDPWWTYFTSQARDVDDLLDQLRRPVLSEQEKQ